MAPPSLQLIETAKRNAASRAVDLLQNGMVIGLGSGSTSRYFIEILAQKAALGLRIQTVATSKPSEILAKTLQLPIVDINTLSELDFSFDGADEIDPKKQMIKGGGGALLREKIVASMSREMVVMIDETKMVSHLGGRPLPIEIIPFGLKATLFHLEKLHFQGTLRKNQDHSLFQTDNGNHLFDIAIKPDSDLKALNEKLLAIPGVLETGFFPNEAGRVIVGFLDGSVSIQ